MKSIAAEGISPERFVTKVRRSMNKGPLKGKVEFEVLGSQMNILFKEMGTSKIIYNVTQTEVGFTALKVNEEIGLTHKFLKKTIEPELVKLMRRLKADVVE